jgi:23S rRNA (uridine2552-2'-O)-methyltransferase
MSGPRAKGGKSKGATKFTGRALTTRVKTAKGRKSSSTRWLQRQLNDPYVAEAQHRGLRSRAAFKLLELDERYGILKPGHKVVDLGAAPGGWTQVALERVGTADVVLSDMAPAATGHRNTDHLRIMGLCDAALDLAVQILAPGGAFVAKVWQGGTETDLLTLMKRRFDQVKHAKPPASRADSAEIYVVAQGFRARESD